MGADSTGRAIFISYRRADAEGEAGRLFDDLVRAFGDDSVFMDVTGINPGVDFRKAIDDNVASCGILLAVLGPMWSSVTDTSGARRLEDANDFVRLEISSALTRGIPVIPVLVHEAQMPRAVDLPDNLKDLAFRNSVELTHTRWNSDVALLINALKSYVNVPTHKENDTVHATLPVQLPAPQSAQPSAPARSSKPLIAAGAAALLLAAAVFGSYFALRKTPEPTPRANLSALTGLWKITGEWTGPDHLEQVEVKTANKGDDVFVQAWGQCVTGLCNWGTNKGFYVDGGVQADFEPKNTPAEIQKKRAVKLLLKPADNDMKVTVSNTWHEPNGVVQSDSRVDSFARIAAAQ